LIFSGTLLATSLVFAAPVVEPITPNKVPVANAPVKTATQAPLSPNAAGKIGYMSGTLVAKRADGTIKVMGRNSEVQAGDMLETSSGSFAQVLMGDGSKMTIRPNSNLKIEVFKFKKEAPTEDNAVFRLVKGGFRTVTGLVGKRGNPDAFRLKAATATIGVRGTDFSSRLCANNDCDDENKAEQSAPAPAPTPKPAIPTVGRVMLVQGDMFAQDASGKQRKIVIGSPVYEGDKLSTGKNAHAVVAFRDSGRVTLQENTIFQVEKFQYKRPDVQENVALRLVKGGVRVVTGLIGRVKHENYRFTVATATIGVRGTGFDTWCTGECTEPAPSVASNNLLNTLASLDGQTPPSDAMTSAQAPFIQVAETQGGNPLNGVGVYVWSGGVTMTTPTGSQSVNAGQAAVWNMGSKPPVPLVNIPASITENKAPRPDTVKVEEKDFDAPAPAETPAGPAETPPAAPSAPADKPADKPADAPAAAQSTPATPAAPAEGGAQGGGAEPGVYVTVHDGKIVLAQSNGKTIDVSKGQTGFVSEQVITKLPSTPAFMSKDKEPEAKDSNTSTKSDSAPSKTGCVVK